MLRCHCILFAQWTHSFSASFRKNEKKICLFYRNLCECLCFVLADFQLSQIGNCFYSITSFCDFFKFFVSYLFQFCLKFFLFYLCVIVLTVFSKCQRKRKLFSVGTIMSLLSLVCYAILAVKTSFLHTTNMKLERVGFFCNSQKYKTFFLYSLVNFLT